MEASIQMWSVRDSVEKKGMRETLKMVGQHGYDGVEFAGFGDLTPDEMKAELDKNNLYSVGSHTGVDLFKTALRENLEYNQKIGSKYMIIPGAKLDSKADVEDLIRLLNESAQVAKEYGLKVGYHNHSKEFEKIDGKYILDMIAEGTSDDVILEVDVFWVAYAGEDPYSYVEKLGKRVELVHMKQIDAQKENVILSAGDIDFKKVVASAKYAKYFVVEQEGDVDKEYASRENAAFMKTL